jgi:hypothetical protein
MQRSEARLKLRPRVRDTETTDITSHGFRQTTIVPVERVRKVLYIYHFASLGP